MSFSETLNGAQLKYATFEKEQHAIVRALDVWKPYLWQRSLASTRIDHDSFRHLKSKIKLQKRHAKRQRPQMQ